MRLYVDIENKKLVQSLNSDRIAPSPNFIQGDNEPIEIHLLSTGDFDRYVDKVLNPEKDFLRVGIARFKGEPKILSLVSGYAPLDGGGCTVMLPLNTTEIDLALGNNASIDAFLEIEYSTDTGRITTILQTQCKLKNDLLANAPDSSVVAQFYTKEQADALFLKGDPKYIKMQVVGVEAEEFRYLCIRKKGDGYTVSSLALEEIEL